MRTLLMALALAAGAASVARIIPDPWPRPPISASEVRRSLGAALERGDRRAVTRGLYDLANMGATLSPETQARLRPLIDPVVLPKRWREAMSRGDPFAGWFAMNAAPRESSEPFAEIPAEHRLIEGIAWDATHDRLFVGSVIDRRLLMRDGETWRVVPTAAPVGGIFGMGVDERRRLLWFASAPADPMPDPGSAFSGLVAIDLNRLEEARRVSVPGAHLGDVALAEDGTLYASDGQSGAIYLCRPGCAAAEILVPPGILRSPQGMVVWPGGRRLYVADYALGLFRMELASRRIRPVLTRQPAMLDGIDGLMRVGDGFVAIQNGNRPHRIIRLSLSDGGRFVSVDPLEANHRDWGEPTLGAIAGREMLYVADGQWERYGPGGALTDGGAPRPTSIRRTTRLIPDILIGGSRRLSTSPGSPPA